VAQYVFALLRAFLPQAEEHRFVLFVLEDDLRLFEVRQGEDAGGHCVGAVRPPVKNILWHQAQLPKLARENQLEVLHVPSYRRLLWPRPCGMVATIHDLAPFHVANKYDWKRML